MTISEEIKATESLEAQMVGKYLEERMRSDKDLKNAWETKNRTLEYIFDLITKEARKRLSHESGKNCVIMTSEEVFNLAVHLVLDAPVEEEKEEPKPVTKKETLEAYLEEDEDENEEEETEKPQPTNKPKSKKQKEAQGEQMSIEDLLAL